MTIEKWKYIKLGALLSPVNERVGKNIHDIPVLSITMHHGLIPQEKKFTKRVASKDLSNYKIVRRGQIVCGFPMDEGVIYTLRTHEKGAVSPAYQVWKIQSNYVDPDFLDLRLKSPDMIETYRRLQTNVVQRRRSISKRDFSEIEIPFPPLKDQINIARSLRITQQDKEITEKVITSTHQLKQSMLHHLFTYGPVPVDEAENVELQETEIGMIPKQWQLKSLGDVIEKPQYGLTASATQEPIGPRFLRITDIQGSTVAWSDVPYTDDVNYEKEKYALQPDDILVARIGATTGKSYLVRKEVDSVFASYLMRLRAKKGLSPEYLYQFMQSPMYWQQINASKGGRLKQGINIPVLQNMLIPVPSLREQDVISDVLTACDKKIEAEESKKEAFDDVFNSLLDHLMTGKVRVNPDKITV